MTEVQWLTYRTPRLLLRGLGCNHETDSRKLRLFAVACWRRVWNSLADARLRMVVDAQEDFSDGVIDEAELSSALTAVVVLREDAELQNQAFWISYFGVRFWPGNVAEPASYLAIRQAGDQAGISPRTSETYLAKRNESRAQADLIREIFGNPFRPSSIDPSWLTWDGGTIPRLALAIYDEKNFDRMPILGDALEEAECTESVILEHCRKGRGHVRGCWVLDALLGRC